MRKHFRDVSAFLISRGIIIMYQYESRIRYSELDENGRIRLLALLNYLQDASTFHGVDCGMTTGHFREIHRAWFISYWDIRIDALPVDGERILVGTSPHDLKGVFAYRNFWLQDKETEKYFVKADSAWFLVNTDTMLPQKLVPEDLAPYGEQADLLQLGLKTRKVVIGKEAGLAFIGEKTVSREMLDTNHHVNNIRYISTAYDMLVDSGMIGAERYPSRIRAEYKHAAAQGDIMEISAAELDGNCLVSILSAEGREFCHLEFSF